ncbi:MAG: hypothetical protein E3J88_06605, partial [Anaerolineales bacterium]
MDTSLTEDPDSNLPDWHTLTNKEVFDRLATDAEKGISSEEAAQRLKEYGLNKLDEAPPTSIWALLWDQFNDFIVLLLIGASLISAILGEWVEAGAIMAIVLLNAILGIIQESRAAEELAALRQLAAPEAHVIR